MKIADHLEMLELSMSVMGVKRIVYPTVIWDAANVILVDTGVPTNLETIKKQMQDAGTSFAKLNIIIASQQDIDHVAGIRGIIKENAQVLVFAHEEDRPYIQGDKKVKRLNSKFMERIKDLPEEERLSVIDMFENSSVKVDRALSDGEVLPYCGGITVIHTPGHTPGHISLYHQKSKTLIAGDAMNILDGQLVGPNRDPMSEDKVNASDALKSLEQFKDYDIENLVTYHGGLFNDRPNEAIKEVIRHRKFFSYRGKN
jgi:glyoxylase-like metal-dependent hydrolase (beta-lactamase superfamily II)